MQELAERLWAARVNGHVMKRDLLSAVSSVDEAYEVQKKIAELSGMGRRGWKIGATSESAQKLIGTNRPAAGALLSSYCYENPAKIAIFSDQNTCVESEFAFRLLRDLPARERVYQRDEVIEAIGAVMPAIEVVASRFEGGFSGLGELRLVADMVANVAWVRGVETLDWSSFDLINHKVSLYRGDEEVAVGSGAEVLGDPVNVMVWTANHLSGMGIGLAAGEVISTGTCTGVVKVGSGDKIVADFNNLGSVTVSFQ